MQATSLYAGGGRGASPRTELMQNEVDPTVFQVVDRIRASSPKLRITEVIEKLGVRDAKYTELKYEYAWRLPGGGSVITIWTEDVRVHPKTGNWFYVDTLDTIHRRGGGLRSDEQRARAERRVDILRDAFMEKASFTGLLQINKVPIAQLEQNKKAEIGVRVKDEDHWHVASWDVRHERAILVRGPRGWVPTQGDIDGPPESDASDEPPAGVFEDQPHLVFPDQKDRDAVEQAAVDYVTQDYEGRGFKVDDVSPKNLGYDLEIIDQDGRTVERVEVKGTSMSTQTFFLTRNEFTCSQSQWTWRLAIVTSALSPHKKLEVLTAQDMCNRFGFDALVWRCTPLRIGSLEGEQDA